MMVENHHRGGPQKKQKGGAPKKTHAGFKATPKREGPQGNPHRGGKEKFERKLGGPPKKKPGRKKRGELIAPGEKKTDTFPTRGNPLRPPKNLVSERGPPIGLTQTRVGDPSKGKGPILKTLLKKKEGEVPKM